MQRFCAVNHVLIASYASLELNPKGVITAGKSHAFFSAKIFMIFVFHAIFLPSISRFNRKLWKRKTKSKKRNDNRKISCSFLSVKIFMIFLCHATFLPSISRFNRKLCKRKTQSKKRNDSRKISCSFLPMKIFIKQKHAISGGGKWTFHQLKGHLSEGSRGVESYNSTS